MANQAQSESGTAEEVPAAETNPPPVAGQAPAPRRPYAAPQLKRLGSVAELTSGVKGSVIEKGGGFKKAG